MSLATIHLRRAMNRAGHIQDRAQDRTTVAVAAHTRAAAAVAVAVDPHPMAAVEVHRHTVAGATANHTRTRAPDPITAREAARALLVRFARRKQNERRTTNRRSFCAQACNCKQRYQTPLSLPVILNATAAAEASGGNKLKRNVAGTLPLKAAWVICFV